MENRNENHLSLENAEVGLDLPGFELDERFVGGFDLFFQGATGFEPRRFGSPVAGGTRIGSGCALLS